MRAIEIYRGSDGALTSNYYALLCERGPLGRVAMNLFRAQKCSARAKKYRGGIRGQGSYRAMAYERKNYSMHELCKMLVEHAAALKLPFGWKQDPAVLFDNRPSWVLYIDLPFGQVSFHCKDRGHGPDFPGEWDGKHLSELRILQFCDAVMDGTIFPRACHLCLYMMDSADHLDAHGMGVCVGLCVRCLGSGECAGQECTICEGRGFEREGDD